ncbi:glycosyltransferase family 4 protein [Roseibium sp. M-1]
MSKIIIDISDLIDWYKHHVNVTGIQRVVEQIFSQKEYFDVENIEFVFRVADRQHFYYIDKNIIFMLAHPDSKLQSIHQIRNLLIEPSTDEKNSEFLRKLKAHPLMVFPWLFNKMISLFPLLYHLVFSDTYEKEDELQIVGIFNFEGGEICVIAGAFWLLGDTATVYEKLRKEKNIVLHVFIYDIIPVSHRYFCDDGLADSFKSQLDLFLPHVDNLISISHYTKSEIENYTKMQGIPTPPIDVLEFGFVSKVLSIDPDLEVDALTALNLADIEFALCVGTVEPRKNPGLLLDVWKTLFRIYRDKTPSLVFVGRRGWKTDWFFGELLKCNYLDGKIRVLHDLSDQNLALLYRKAKVVLFPSYIEGWGLPVEEAIAFGKYTLASNRSSIPEAGRDCAFYFDPYDQAALKEELTKCFYEENHVSKKEMLISEKRKEFAQNYTWQKTAEQLLEIVTTKKQV